MSTLNSLFDYGSLLKELRNSNSILSSETLDPIFSNPRISAYFDRVPDSREAKHKDASIEKMLGTVIATTINQTTGIPVEDVVNGTRKALELIRSTKMKYLLESGKISQKTYNKLTNYSSSSTWIAAIKSAYKYLQKKGAKKLVKKAIAFVVKKIPNPVVQTAMRIWEITPQPIKEVAKRAARWCVDKATEKVQEIQQKLYDAGKKVVVKSAEIIHRGIRRAHEKGKQIVGCVKDFVKSAVEKVASWGSKAKEKIFNFFRR